MMVKYEVLKPWEVCKVAVHNGKVQFVTRYCSVMQPVACGGN